MEDNEKVVETIKKKDDKRVLPLKKIAILGLLATSLLTSCTTLDGLVEDSTYGNIEEENQEVRLTQDDLPNLDYQSNKRISVLQNFHNDNLVKYLKYMCAANLARDIKSGDIKCKDPKVALQVIQTTCNFVFVSPEMQPVQDECLSAIGGSIEDVNKFYEKILVPVKKEVEAIENLYISNGMSFDENGASFVDYLTDNSIGVYNTTLQSSCENLNLNEDDSKLLQYSFNNFYKETFYSEEHDVVYFNTDSKRWGVREGYTKISPQEFENVICNDSGMSIGQVGAKEALNQIRLEKMQAFVNNKIQEKNKTTMVRTGRQAVNFESKTSANENWFERIH